jgi:hypothetical protein
MYEGRDCYGCPLRNIDPGTHELIGLYSHYKQGFLYYEGGISAQPYKYVRAMQVIGAEFAKVERDHLEKRSRAPGKIG